MKFCWVGASWAIKGFTEQNYENQKKDPEDIRVPDFWNMPFNSCCIGGVGCLTLLDKLKSLNINPKLPIIWLYGAIEREYGRVTGDVEHGWMMREDYFEMRKDLDQKILTIIRENLPNPIGLIGGDTDINVEYAESLGFHVLDKSWQRWIAEKLNSQWFKFGWNASDVGWRMFSNNITPSKSVVFAWDEQIKEWCWWEEQGYFCHEHPTPKCHKEFAEYLQPKVQQWLESLS